MIAKSFEEIKDIFMAHLNTQSTLVKYPSHFLSHRSNYIRWIIEICQKLYLKKETLHGTISLFDLYTTKANQKELEDYFEIKLAVVACLSIATKLNELNNDCMRFFTHNILNNAKQDHQYTVQDLVMKEKEILSTIDYETNHSNVYHFNAIFSSVALDYLNSTHDKEQYQKLNERVVTHFLLTDYCVSMSPINSAIFIFNKTLENFDLSKGSTKKIVEVLGALAFKNKKCDPIVQ